MKKFVLAAICLFLSVVTVQAEYDAQAGFKLAPTNLDELASLGLRTKESRSEQVGTPRLERFNLVVPVKKHRGASFAPAKM
jgi:hypothetical protein